jgi:tol-pal system protein YbgF
MSTAPKWFCGILLSYTLCSGVGFADDVKAPVEHVTLPPTQSVALLSEEKFTRLEQQLKNFTDMDFPGQINALQDQVKKLQGAIDVQQEELKSLKKQNRAFYEDFNQRMTQIQNLNPGNSDVQTGLQPGALPPDASIVLQDSTDYQTARNLLVLKKQYEKAKKSFRNYLNNYPNGTYVSDAHYWLGDIYLSQKAKQQAVSEFLIVVNQFPQSAKAGAAHLKLGIAYADMGKTTDAKRELSIVKNQQPGSVVAQLATIRLQQIKEIESRSEKAPLKSEK